jgi:protein-L-isoaspartate(D-aspartate) O-methyltransferase
MSGIDYNALRETMILTQLRPNEVNAPALLNAIRAVAREAFVPEGAAQALCYTDRPADLGNGRALNPVLTSARLLLAAGVKPGDSLLIIGAATGYSAAVAAALGVKVVALESDAVLARKARSLLAAYPNVRLVEAPLNTGALGPAPYDAIIVDGGVEELPEALLEQLAAQGVLVAAWQADGASRICSLNKEGHMREIADLQAVALPSFAKEKAFSFA